MLVWNQLSTNRPWDKGGGIQLMGCFSAHTGSWGKLISECLGFLCDSNLVVFACSRCSNSFSLPVSLVVASTPIWLIRMTQEIFCSLETVFLGENCSESPECLWSLWVSLGPWILSTLKVKPLTSKTENLCVLSVHSCCLGTAICSDPVLLVRRVVMYETDVKQAKSILPLGTVLHVLWYSMYFVRSKYSGVSWVAWGKDEWDGWRQSCLWLSSNLWSDALLRAVFPEETSLPQWSFPNRCQWWWSPWSVWRTCLWCTVVVEVFVDGSLQPVKCSLVCLLAEKGSIL